MSGFLMTLILAASASGTVVERIVAQVNGKIITESDVYAREQSLLTDLYRQQMPPEELTRRLEEARKSLVPDIIHETLLVQRANDLGITVGPDQIDAVIESIMASNNIADLDALRSALATEGLSIEQLRANVAQRTLIEKVKQFEIASRIVVTDDEIKKYYEENKDQFRLPERVHLREIVLLDEGRSPEKVLSEIREIRQLVDNGSDFAELATFFSQAPSSDHGGDMGTVELATLNDEIREAAMKLEPGEVSEPITTRFGYHLLKLEERQPRGLRPLSEARPQILQTLQLKRYNADIQVYMQELIDKAYIKFFDAPPGAREYELSAELLGG